MTIATDRDLKVVQELNLIGGSKALNVYYFRTDFAAPQDEDAVLDAVEEWVQDLYSNLIPQVVSGVTMGLLTLYQYDVVGIEWDLVGTRTPTVAFTAAGDMFPHGVACMSRAYTQLSRTIGRKYLAGLDENTATDGAWTVGCLAAVADFNTQWATSKQIIINNDLLPGVWTTRLSYVVLLTGTFVVLADAAYQRRRRPGVGI